MPVYLVHGFRWPRGGFTGIRVHIIIHNLEDCSAEYIQNPNSQAELLKSFRHAYPEIMKELEPPSLGSEGKGVQFLEQYDPEDEQGENAASQPFAFVGDRVVMIAGGPAATSVGGNNMESTTVTSPTSTAAASEPATPASAKRSSKGSVGAGIEAAAAMKTQALSLNVEDVVAEGPGVTAAAWEAFADLRDKIAPGEKIGWWVVYNGEPERAYDSHDDDEEVVEEEEEQAAEEENYARKGEADAIAQRVGGQQYPQLSPKPSPTAPLAERTRPPQLAPKPRMFDPSDPDRGDPQRSPLTALRSPAAKGSGKRLPGMKAAPQPQQQQQQQQPQEQRPQWPQETQPTKPRVAPKSESLKKKLFGKRS